MKDYLENVNRRMDDFFFDLIYIIVAFVIGYAGVYIYIGAPYLGFSYFVILGLGLPFYLKFKNSNNHNALKMLVIAIANLCIYLPVVFLDISINAEFYYVPALILPFVLFRTNYKNWILLGSALPLFFWSLQVYSPVQWPTNHLTPTDFPTEFFQKINVMGSFIITMLIMTRYQIYLFGFKFAAEREIEQTKMVEQNLEEAQRIAKVGNWQLDLKNQNLFWSKEQYRIFGIEGVTPDKLFKECMDRFHKDDLHIVEIAIQKSIHDQKPFQFEHRIIVNNQTKHMLVRGEPILDKNGLIVGLFGTGQDITERKITEKLVEEQQLKLLSSSKLASLGEMAGGIAHEINNPLSIIKSKSELVLKQLGTVPSVDPKLVSDIELISQTSDRIAKIIRGLRSLTRNSESDPHQKISAKSVIDDVVTLCRQRLTNHGIKLSVEINTSCELHCRPAEIGQVLMNLINNGADAVEHLENKWISLIASEVEQKLEIRIKDSGHGIPTLIADKMMNPFFTTKDVGRGTGLGLSISRGIIERHGGYLSYNPQSDNTEFVIQMPLAKS